MESIPNLNEDVTLRANELMAEHQVQIYTNTSHLFAILMLVPSLTINDGIGTPIHVEAPAGEHAGH